MTVKETIMELMDFDMDDEVQPYILAKTDEIECNESEAELFGDIVKIEKDSLSDKRVWLTFEY